MTNLRLRYVKAYVDRHGKARHYFRKPGCKPLALPGLPGSDEFMAAYSTALANAPRVEVANLTTGAIINAKQFRKVCGYVEEGIAQPGSTLLIGGLPPKSGPLAQGYFALPTIFAGLRISLGVSLVVLVSAEFVASNSGIGYLIWTSWQTLVVENMFVGIIVVTILGVLTTFLLHKCERLLVPWRQH